MKVHNARSLRAEEELKECNRGVTILVHIVAVLPRRPGETDRERGPDISILRKHHSSARNNSTSHRNLSEVSGVHVHNAKNVGDPNTTTQITVPPLTRTVVAVEERAISQGCVSERRQEWRGRKTKTDGVRCQKPAMAAETETETVIKDLIGSRSVVEQLCDILFVMIILLPLRLA